MKTNLKIAGLLATMCLSAFANKPEVDSAIPDYKPVSGVSGNLSSIGSDTLNNLMTLWAEGFQKQYPSVKIGVEGKGSSTAPPALMKGTAQLGPMSRPMKREEVDSFEKQFGYKPLEIPVALDALAVFVHKDNPVNAISMQQVDSVFSNTYKRGGEKIKQWGGLGVADWKDRDIALYGRNSASGTYGFFKEHALNKGDFSDYVKEQPGSSAVVSAVSSDPYAMGYSGVGYMTSGVKALALSPKNAAEGQKIDQIAFAPSYENCLSGKYPLSRFLNIVVNKAPGKPLDPLTKEFIKFVLSKEGQQIVVKDGYYPLPAKVTEKILKKLD